jgi:hypothetical protein
MWLAVALHEKVVLKVVPVSSAGGHIEMRSCSCIFCDVKIAFSS